MDTIKMDTLEIMEYFTAENRKHWLDEIGRCEWGAGAAVLYSAAVPLERFRRMENAPTSSAVRKRGLTDATSAGNWTTAKKAFTKTAATAGLQRHRLSLSENMARKSFYTRTIS